MADVEPNQRDELPREIRPLDDVDAPGQAEVEVPVEATRAVGSPDGTRSAYETGGGVKSCIVVVNADGSNEATLAHLTAPTGDATMVSLRSKRGSWIGAASGTTPVSVSSWRTERSNRGQECTR